MKKRFEDIGKGSLVYVCAECGMSIRNLEKCVLEHIRDGKVVGRAKGLYNGKHPMIHNNVFFNNDFVDINSAKEIEISERVYENSGLRAFHADCYKTHLKFSSSHHVNDDEMSGMMLDPHYARHEKLFSSYEYEEFVLLETMAGRDIVIQTRPSYAELLKEAPFDNQFFLEERFGKDIATIGFIGEEDEYDRLGALANGLVLSVGFSNEDKSAKHLVCVCESLKNGRCMEHYGTFNISEIPNNWVLGLVDVIGRSLGDRLESFLEQAEKPPVKMITVSGPSAAGKDKLIGRIEQDYGFKLAVSYTSRAMRTEEQEGREYYFTSKKEIRRMERNDELIEMRVFPETQAGGAVVDLLYGLTWDEFFEKSATGPCTMAADIHGLQEIVEALGRERVLSIFIDAPDEMLKERARKRDGNFNEDKFAERLEDDRQIFSEFDDYDLSVENIDFEECYSKVKAAIDAVLEPR